MSIESRELLMPAYKSFRYFEVGCLLIKHVTRAIYMYRKLSHMNYACITQTYSIIHLKCHATNDFQHQNWVQQASVAAVVAIFVAL